KCNLLGIGYRHFRSLFESLSTIPRKRSDLTWVLGQAIWADRPYSRILFVSYRSPGIHGGRTIFRNQGLALCSGYARGILHSPFRHYFVDLWLHSVWRTTQLDAHGPNPISLLLHWDIWIFSLSSLC